MRKRLLFLIVVLSGWMVTTHGAGPRFDEGATGLALALRKLPMTGSFMYTAAHPDDEDNPLLVMLGRGRGYRTSLFTMTRGDGGQNEIGPELFEELGVIRTGELMAMHDYDGAQQYFTHAFEFGYSYSVEETLAKWGKEEMLGEMVRVIRKFRPQVIVSLPRFGEGGGQHHQASALLTAEAFRAAADPEMFPEQLAEGLHAWQTSKLYERERWLGPRSNDPPEGVAMQTGLFDPLLGRTYAQIGMESRSLHRCQGMGQLVPLAGPVSSYWKLVDSVIPVAESEKDLFDGIDTTLFSLVGYVGQELDRVPFLTQSLQRIQTSIDAAQRHFDPNLPEASAPALAAGLAEVRELRRQIRSSPLSADKSYHLLFLLENKENDFRKALALSRQIAFEVLAEDGTVVAGQTVQVTLSVANGGTRPLTIEGLELATPAGWTVETIEGEEPVTEILGGQTASQSFQVTVDGNAEPTRPYWRRPDPTVDLFQVDARYRNQPWTDPPVSGLVKFHSDGVAGSISKPAEFRYAGPWVGGEQRHDLMVVPAISVRLSEENIILPASSTDRGREIRVHLQYEGDGPASGSVKLLAPEGWETGPTQDFSFQQSGESATRRYFLKPPKGLQQGEFTLSAEARLADRSFQEGYRVIDYDHIRRQHWFRPAEATIKIIDVAVAPVKLAYIEGVGDEVAESLQQLGIAFDTLSPDDLAFGDLDQYQTIITGVRAYLVREDLKSHNARLLEWVNRGGVLIVQYNKFEFNLRGRDDSPYAPYPVKVGRGRVTDENAPIRLLDPQNPVFRFPNQLEPADWQGWVQERGLYFLGDKDDRYRDLVSTEDPFEYNSGEQLGALVEADYGKGKWIYVGLGLWRELPAGVPGAYRLLANLISLPAAN